MTTKESVTAGPDTPALTKQEINRRLLQCAHAQSHAFGCDAEQSRMLASGKLAAWLMANAEPLLRAALAGLEARKWEWNPQEYIVALRMPFKDALAEALLLTGGPSDSRESPRLAMERAHKRIAVLCEELGVTIDDFHAPPDSKREEGREETLTELHRLGEQFLDDMAAPASPSVSPSHELAVKTIMDFDPTFSRERAEIMARGILNVLSAFEASAAAPTPPASGDAFEAARELTARDNAWLKSVAPEFSDTPPASDLVERLEDLANEYGRINSWPKPLIQEAAAEILKLQEELDREKKVHMRTAMGLHKCDEHSRTLQERVGELEAKCIHYENLANVTYLENQAALTAAKQENERLKSALQQIMAALDPLQSIQPSADAIYLIARAALATEVSGK